MVDELEKTPIQDRVRQRFADDLAANRREQEEVTGQITGLQERLEQLRTDEAWLTQAQGSLPGALAPSEPAAEPDGASAEAVTDAPHVPQPRQDQPAQAEPPRGPAEKAAAKEKTTAKKTATKKTAAKRTAAKKTAAKKTAVKKAAAEQAPASEAATAEAPAKKAEAEEKSGPPLGELLLALLLKAPGEPRLAREVADQLAQEHPSRVTTIQTVRNTLNRLAEKDVIEKATRQGSPMYTAYADEGAPPAPAAVGPADGEGEQAAETAAEKVPAEV